MFRNLSVEDLKTNLVDIIDDFININFTLHPKAISETANKKIRNGDVILTFSHSKLVERVLLDAVVSGKKIKVIVSDGRPQQLGRRLTDRLGRDYPLRLVRGSQPSSEEIFSHRWAGLQPYSLAILSRTSTRRLELYLHILT